MVKSCLLEDQPVPEEKGGSFLSVLLEDVQLADLTGWLAGI